MRRNFWDHRKYGRLLAGVLAAALWTAMPAYGAVGAPAGMDFVKRDAVHVGQMPGGGAEGGIQNSPVQAGNAGSPEGSSSGGTGTIIAGGAETPTGGPGVVGSGNGAPSMGGGAPVVSGENGAPVAEANSGSPVISAGSGTQPQGVGEQAPPSQTSSGDQASAGAVVVPIDPATGLPIGQPAAQEPAQDTQAGNTAAQSSGRQLDGSKPMVALTFDDGPQPSVGNRIMDCLAQYGGKATFFMVGDRVAARASEVQRMVAEGHEVANHTMNHKYLQTLGASAIQAQVNQANDAIQAACGVRPTLMRLPGGNHNSTVLANTGMPMIQWNIDTLDWKTRDAAKTVAAVVGKVKDGDIVLMHELYSQSGDAALQIIPALVNQGFQLVTVSEMAAAKGYNLQAGKLYSSFR